MDNRFARAVAAFTAVSAGDPAREIDGGEARPRELVQSERLVRWVQRLAPDASEALRLAAHCQHIGRFQLPRASYPDGRSGYLRWRSELARRHAETAHEILSGLGYDEATVEHVRRIVLKQNLSRDADVQLMEDALCLSFLEHELSEFAARHEDAKVVSILRKTWRKMSPRARDLALTLPLDGRSAKLVGLALEPTGP
ncbi:MAG TPA: DUF4202 domain-containing protein [Polyangiaceae bacterium]|nr:DUF4202 domain-containing protein [Polyangiaceae bacterium]